ncbi:MAG: ChbG/HpnK family deacetylase [Lachnospiraceae bacterium]|nr:ChbG/HpnK family deacetylase [Candidatus Colinaster scatohippi]
MYTLDYHGDDYGISMNNCIRFVELMKAGKIDSISIVPNMGCFDEAMEYLNKNWPDIYSKPFISVHINLVDGFSLARLNACTFTKSDESGILMNASWGKLLIRSFLPGKKRLRMLLSEEIAAQIKRVYDNVPDGVNLRLDSHQHTHMIPIVFDAMMDAVESLELLDKTDYVRVSREPLWMFINTKGVRGTFPLINIVKNILLNMLSGRAERILKAHGIKYGCLWGLIMTGRMDRDRVDRILPKMEKYAASNEKYVEILCHPGIVLEAEKRKEYGTDDLKAFFSENRNIEYQMLMSR